MKRDNNQNVRGLLMFLLSFLPGVAHMYLGLMKRGIQLLLSFLICLSLATSYFLNIQFITVPLLIVIFIYSFFDGYSCLRQMRNGEQIQDESIFKEIISMTKSMKINKSWVGIALIILGLVLILNVITRSYYFIDSVNQAARFIMDTLPAILFFILGISLIFRNNKESEEIDTTKDSDILPDENNQQ